MFFCDSCADKKKWPKSGFRSRGTCEICDLVADCSSIPSRDLPLPPKEKTIIWIVTDKGKGAEKILRPFVDKTKVFTDYEAACIFAKDCGFGAGGWMTFGITKTPGITSLESCGDIHVEVLCTYLDPPMDFMFKLPDVDRIWRFREDKLYCWHEHGDCWVDIESVACGSDRVKWWEHSLPRLEKFEGNLPWL